MSDNPIHSPMPSPFPPSYNIFAIILQRLVAIQNQQLAQARQLASLMDAINDVEIRESSLAAAVAALAQADATVASAVEAGIAQSEVLIATLTQSSTSSFTAIEASIAQIWTFLTTPPPPPQPAGIEVVFTKN
jgi:hypothetical protein